MLTLLSLYSTVHAIHTAPCSAHCCCTMYNSDVKPANFMAGLPDSADSDTVFLVDFGVATRFLGKFINKVEI